MAINGENIRKIHKKLLEITLKMPQMYLFMVKVANRAKKTIDNRKSKEENADLLLLLLRKHDYNGKIKRVINKVLVDKAEEGKQSIINGYIDNSREVGKWFYLASSHNDSALDHKPYQGKIYYDEKAPDEIVKYAKSHGYKSIQWVMGEPVWFITRPNCRHFFKSLPLDIIKQYSNKELIRRYKMHRMDGDRSLATPRKIAIEEYEDRLKLLKALNSSHQTESLRRAIGKTEILIKKWKKIL